VVVSADSVVEVVHLSWPDNNASILDFGSLPTI